MRRSSEECEAPLSCFFPLFHQTVSSLGKALSVGKPHVGASPVLRAAQYVRMSTEHQQYSPANQTDGISSYAARHGIEVVHTYADHGRSGLDLEGRAGLRRLIDDVIHGRHDFSDLLVYDVSRWGRFQDVDESAYYEYVCKRAGVKIHYCAEQFQNDGSLASMLLKTIKRSMAAEYSRELSCKVFAGQSRVVEMGYRNGGPAGFGYRRQLIDRNGNVRCVLEPGERKSIQTDRIVLIPGPQEEVSVVQTIFDLYILARLSTRAIAQLLTERGIPIFGRRRWNKHTVQRILANPMYVGANVYNRRSYKLHKKIVHNPPEMWIRRDGAFEPIIPLETFLMAQEITRSKTITLTNDELLEHLRRLWNKEGKISARLINQAPGMPYVCCFIKRFGSLNDACQLIQHPPLQRHTYNRMVPHLRRMHRELYASIKAQLLSDGATVEEGRREDIFRVNSEFTVRLRLCYCNESTTVPRWSVCFGRMSRTDVTLAVRLKPGNSEILDYFILPNLAELGGRVLLGRDNPCKVDVYRFDSLDFFFRLSKRRKLEDMR